jgi:acylglycerol lipase
MKNTESYFQFKKYDIFAQSWLTEKSIDKSSEGQSEYHLIIVHGLGEHSSSYNHMAKYLCDHGISCHSFDLIGHGQSSGQRGYTPSFELFVEQLSFIYNEVSNKYKSANIAIFAHSMGGLVTLKALMEKTFPNDLKLIFSNPLVNINIEIPQWKLSLANGLAQLLPRLAMGNEINNNDLTKDAEVIERYSQDPLRHKKISAKLFIELQETTGLVSSQLEDIKNPSLFLLSPNDKVCDANATEKLSKSFQNAKLELFPQSGHEIVNDLSKTKAFDDIINFLKGNL